MYMTNKKHFKLQIYTIQTKYLLSCLINIIELLKKLRYVFNFYVFLLVFYADSQRGHRYIIYVSKKDGEKDGKKVKA